MLESKVSCYLCLMTLIKDLFSLIRETRSYFSITLTALLHVDLINVGYLTACIYVSDQHDAVQFE